jgi:hypothetical protein
MGGPEQPTARVIFEYTALLANSATVLSAAAADVRTAPERANFDEIWARSPTRVLTGQAQHRGCECGFALFVVEGPSIADVPKPASAGN